MSSSRHLRFAMLALSVSAAMILSGCMGGNDEDGGQSLVNTYVPAYLEAKGTVHAGDWFPLREGDTAWFKGTLTGTDRRSARGMVEGETVSEDTLEPFALKTAGEKITDPPESLPFPQGTFTVIPQVTIFEYAPIDSSDIPNSGWQTSTAFYYKDANAIYRPDMQSASTPSSSPMPIFLKLPLKVGDSWDVAVEEAPDLSAEGSATSSARAVIFVVGLETVTVGGKPVSALRLDQVSEVSATLDGGDGSYMTMKAEAKSIIHLVEGQGVVREYHSEKTTMKQSFSQGSDHLTITGLTDAQGIMERTDRPEIEELPKSAVPRVQAPAPSRVPGPPAAILSAWVAARTASLTGLFRMPFRTP